MIKNSWRTSGKGTVRGMWVGGIREARRGKVGVYKIDGGVEGMFTSVQSIKTSLLCSKYWHSWNNFENIYLVDGI